MARTPTGPREFSPRHYRFGPGGRLIERSPTVCPAGHPLGPDRMLVGSHPCVACTGRGHRTWTCRRCDATWVWPACRAQPDWPEWPGLR